MIDIVLDFLADPVVADFSCRKSEVYICMDSGLSRERAQNFKKIPHARIKKHGLPASFPRRKASP
jgi:hypothetical protein